MTIEELKDYFKSAYAFNKQTGMSCTSYATWLAQGFIPVNSQMRLQKMTDGKLVARIEDSNEV